MKYAKSVNEHGSREFKATCGLNESVNELVVFLIDGASVDPFVATTEDRQTLKQIEFLLEQAKSLAAKLPK
jgi:hypothetical protein